jgi:hypothetical protein
MANLIRSAKSGRDWSTNELLAYNITVRCQDIVSFFGHELGSIDHLDANLFSSADPTIAVDFSKETYRVQMLGRKVPSMTWRKVFLRLQVLTRLA